MKSKSRYLLAAFLSVAIWGFFSIPLRNIKAFPAEEILYYRIFTSLIVIWAAIFLFRRNILKQDLQFYRSASLKDKKIIVYQVIGASVLLTLNWYTFIYAVNNVSLKSAAFAYMVCPLITAFGGFVILKEELSKIKLAALAIALMSIIMLATGSFIEVLWSVIIAALYAFYLIIQRKMQYLDKLNVLALQITVAVVLMLPFYIYHHESFPVGTWFWGHIIVIAVLFTVIPLFLSLYALIGIPSSTLGIIIYLNPIIAFTVAVLYFDEKISAHQLLAYLLLLSAVFLFNWNLIKDIFTFKRK
ncbi:EamA family transporter [Pedobacter insulae]|uniref:Chloramphenicol-sensitive protein RarD n=1 Tax=Pedobacter insulae TaxID=414048 RepID=A0A1I2YRS4_9SPHI|nr:EamA family transporter [Pedobacter insulae]SFH28354.1 chloramphenicol-sensitive protein RarD [Pedobacter insulae]